APFSWTGFYLGANLGGGWADIERQYTPIPGVAPAQLHLNQHASGVRGGGQLGYQHQFGSLVLGVELAYTGGRLKGTGPDAAFFAPFFDASSKLHNVFQVGPRIGWTPSHKWLVYASGGYATTEIETGFWFRPLGPSTGTFDTTRHDGWYIGGGVE